MVWIEVKKCNDETLTAWFWKYKNVSFQRKYMRWDILTVKMKNAEDKNRKSKVSNHTWHANNWKHFFPAVIMTLRKAPHSVCTNLQAYTDTRKRLWHKCIQNSLHKTWKWIMSLYPPQSPHVSESEHPSHSTSLWFLPYFNHVASFSEFVLPQHVYACEHLSWSTTQFPYVLLMGAAGVSVLLLWCGWHRSDGADSLCWQFVIQSVSQLCYTIPPQCTHYFLNLSTSRC